MTRIVAVAIFLITSLSSFAVIVNDSIKARFDHRLITPLEGVWQIPDGAVLCIEKSHVAGGEYAITLLQSPDLRMPAPAIIGCLKSAKSGDYTTVIATNVRNGKLCDRQSFNTKLRSDGTLTLTHNSALPKIRISMILRFLGPAIGISKHASPGNIDLVAKRIYPAPAPSAFNPVAL